MDNPPFVADFPNQPPFLSGAFKPTIFDTMDVAALW